MRATRSAARGGGRRAGLIAAVGLAAVPGDPPALPHVCGVGRRRAEAGFSGDAVPAALTGAAAGEPRGPPAPAAGVHPAMIRTHSRALGPGATPGNRRRNSTMADSSPSSVNTRRMAASSASSTANMRRTMAARQPAAQAGLRHPSRMPGSGGTALTPTAARDLLLCRWQSVAVRLRARAAGQAQDPALCPGVARTCPAAFSAPNGQLTSVIMLPCYFLTMIFRYQASERSRNSTIARSTRSCTSAPSMTARTLSFR